MKFKNDKASRESAWDAKHKGESAADFDMDDIFQVAERELINPKLSKWDKQDLHELLMKELKEFVDSAKMQPYCNFQGEEFEQEIEKVFPKYLFYDTFNINHTPTEGIKMGMVDESNKWLFDFLMTKASDYYFKAVTEGSNFNSYVLTTEIAKQLLLLYQQQNPEGPKDDGEGDDGQGKSGIQKMLESMGGNKAGNNKLDQAMEQARKNAEQEIEKNEDTADATGGMEAGKDLGSLSFGEIQEFMDYTEAIKHIKLKSDLINNFVKTTLKLSKTYFSSKYKELEEEILEAEEIDDIQGMENVHPALKRVHLDDIVTHARQYHMKFDVYVDISGSMDSRIYQLGNRNSNISGLDMAKITCLKLKSLGYVEDVYPFEGHVHPPMRDALAIATMNTCGGTSIDSVIRNVRKTGRPSVVITDMQDSIQEYDDNVYFIGILGAGFEQFRDTRYGGTAGPQYLQNKQCVAYNDDNSFSYVV